MVDADTIEKERGVPSRKLENDFFETRARNKELANITTKGSPRTSPPKFDQPAPASFQINNYLDSEVVPLPTACLTSLHPACRPATRNCATLRAGRT